MCLGRSNSSKPYDVKSVVFKKLNITQKDRLVQAVLLTKGGRSGETRTHGLQLPKLARYRLRNTPVEV